MKLTKVKEWIKENKGLTIAITVLSILLILLIPLKGYKLFGLVVGPIPSSPIRLPVGVNFITIDQGKETMDGDTIFTGQSITTNFAVKNIGANTETFMVEMGILPLSTAVEWFGEFPRALSVMLPETAYIDRPECCSGQENIQDLFITLAPGEEGLIDVSKMGSITINPSTVDLCHGENSMWAGEGTYIIYFQIFKDCWPNNVPYTGTIYKVVDIKIPPGGCTLSCDDGNPCTIDTKDYVNCECDHTPLSGDQEECSGEENCLKTTCNNGACTETEIIGCTICGDGNCAGDETYSSCTSDCPDPCIGVQCPDKCSPDGYYLMKSGVCGLGECQYSYESCTYGCDSITLRCAGEPGECISDHDCDDSNKCTFDKCLDKKCKHQAIEGCGPSQDYTIIIFIVISVIIAIAYIMIRRRK